MQSRIIKLREIAEQTGVDAIALIPGPNLYYLTGSNHHAMERPFILFVPRHGEPVGVLPSLEADNLAQHFDAKLYRWTDDEGYNNAFAAALKELNLKSLGVEGQKMRYFESEILQRHAPDLEIRSIDKELSYFRIAKSADDLAKLKKAIEISEQALNMTLDQVRVGMTERQIASRLMMNLYSAGGEGLSFTPIVLGGANSALPHGHPGDYVLKEGDTLLFDFGAIYGGYLADITRTFFLGEPSDHHKAVYNAVKAANEAGRKAAKPGVTAESVDAAARQAMVDAGFEQYIVHRTGHGLGLEAHEHPNIVKGNTQILEPGMVFTIEPGLYLVGDIGVRIEDNMVITQDGAQSLTEYPRDIQVIK